jgi:hypothetical protein
MNIIWINMEKYMELMEFIYRCCMHIFIPIYLYVQVVNLNGNQIAAVDPDAFSQLKDLTVCHCF